MSTRPCPFCDSTQLTVVHDDTCDSWCSSVCCEDCGTTGPIFGMVPGAMMNTPLRTQEAYRLWDGRRALSAAATKISAGLSSLPKVDPGIAEVIEAMLEILPEGVHCEVKNATDTDEYVIKLRWRDVLRCNTAPALTDVRETSPNRVATIYLNCLTYAVGSRECWTSILRDRVSNIFNGGRVSNEQEGRVARGSGSA